MLGSEAIVLPVMNYIFSMSMVFKISNTLMKLIMLQGGMHDGCILPTSMAQGTISTQFLPAYWRTQGYVLHALIMLTWPGASNSFLK